jgi:hypothetical protein
MSMEFCEDSDRDPSASPTLLEQPPVPEDTLPADDPSQPTVVDRLQQLRWIHVPIILVMAILGMLVSLRWRTHIVGSFQLYDVLYLLSLPYVALGIWGLLTRTPPLPADPQRTLGRLIICLVTKGTNPEVVLRTYRRLLPLCGPQVELCVVTDNPVPIPHLLVPATFRARCARYKARALEYFRQQQRFGPGDWVLHLDEESVLDARGLRACEEYCRRSPYLYGQGPIFYNNHEFWRYPVETAADCIRAADDVGKFHLQLARLRWPIFGLHGSFLLVKGSLEDEITWDLQGSLVEDYAFAVECMRRGLGVGEVAGIVREQSTRTLADFLRQRRRWLVGMRGLSRMSPWARLWAVLWSASPLVRAATVAHVLAGHLSLTLVVVGNFFSATFLYLYLLGSVIQDVDRRTPLGRLLWHALLTGILFPVSYTLEGIAVLWSFVSREQRIGFQTVRK